MKKTIIYIGFVLSLANVAKAQTVTSYQLTIFNGATVVSTTQIAAANFVCNSPTPTPPVGTVPNPRHIWFNDPVNAGMVCLFTDNGTNGPLSSLPFSTTVYTAEIEAINIAGSSPESAASNLFTEPGAALNAPTGVKVGS